MAEEDNKVRIQAIGDRIRYLRIEAGFTSYETFANTYDLARKSYWQCETGSNYKIKTLLRIIDIHGITLEEFFKGLK